MMKSETVEEARERLKAMTAAEREGFEAASEGQLVIEIPEEVRERAAKVDQVTEAYEGAMVNSQGGVFTSDLRDSNDSVPRESGFAGPSEDEAPARRRAGRPAQK